MLTGVLVEPFAGGPHGHVGCGGGLAGAGGAAAGILGVLGTILGFGLTSI